jgi:hypothetical protein
MELNEDIKLQLLGGKETPISIDNIEIIPLSLREIVKMKYSKYNQYLANLISDPIDFGITDKNITTFDVLYGGIWYGDDKFRDYILEALQLFIKEDITPNSKYGFELSGGRYLNRENYEEFKQVLKWQNCIEEDKEFKPANKRAEEFKKRILQARQKVAKRKGLSFADIISSYSIVCDGINISSIWDLTLYQFFNQMSRYKMFEEYKTGLQSLFAGAKPESVDLKHYVRPIEN